MKETKFKQTDIGLIPEDWKIDILDKAFQFLPTNTYAREFMNEKTGDVHNIHYGDILVKYGSIVDFERDSVPYLKQSVDSGDERNYLKNGDLIIADTAEDKTAGKTVEIFNLGGKKAVAGLHTFACRPKIDFASKYLGYFSNCAFFHNQMLPYFTGTKVTSISKSCIKKIFVTYPSSKDEQERIANALSQVDDLLAALDEQIEKKKLIKQGTMQQLLTGKTRLNGFTGEWKTVKLGDVLDYEQPSNYQVLSTQYLEKGVPVLTAGKTFILGYTAEKTGVYNKLPVIIFDDFVAESKYVDFPFKVKSSAVKMLKLKKEKDSLRFVYEIMQIIDFVVADHKRHWISDYSLIEIKMPEPSEQQAIASILSTMDEEIQTLQEERDKYALIKQGMMQQLLTGKIRLN